MNVSQKQVARKFVERDAFRRSLVTNCATYFNSSLVGSSRYAFDALSRPVARTTEATGGSPVASSFAYNDRSEVLSASIGANFFAHAYDDIGNHLLFGDNDATNTFTHNALNQMVGRAAPSAPPATFTYTPDGGLASDGTWSYAYDAEDQLVSVTSASLTNGAIRVLNAYDYRRRRVSKTVQRLNSTGQPPAGTQEWETTETRTFVYDDWNLIHETIYAVRSGVTNATEVQYFWGLDLSDTLQGAGGVGGLLAVSRNGWFYFPTFDNNGNVTRYVNKSGKVVAAYEYDDFGRTISQSGSLASIFRHRFSTKYYDPETGLYYYGYRFYHPVLMCWLNRDPMEEEGGINIYSMCENNLVDACDDLGLWSVTSESKEHSRRVYRFEKGDTMESLANIVGLAPNEYQKWGRVEKSAIADKATSVLVSSNTKPGCYVSVPNVWISADLLRGGDGCWDSIVNLGGTIGRAVGTGLFTSSGYKIINADDIKQLNAAFRASKGDIWGIVVFGHGNEDGRLSMRRSTGVLDQDWTYQSELITGIQAGGYKIASAYMMQCYSAYKGKDSSGKNVDYGAEWRKVAIRFYGYRGMNVLLKDFGSSGKKKRKHRNGRRW